MVLGDNEIDNGQAALKNMGTGEIVAVDLDKLCDFFK